MRFLRDLIIVLLIMILLSFITGMLDKQAAARAAYNATFGWLKGLK